MTTLPEFPRGFSGGVATDLGTLGGSASVARALNASGWIVGNADLEFDEYCHAFLYKDGVMLDLGTLVGAEGCSFAYGINAAGQVVGWSDTAGGEFRAFLWDEVGGMVDLGSLAAEQRGARHQHPRADRRWRLELRKR